MRDIYPNELYHYGILGQKWGVRRFQNPDGTLTPAGRRRYGTVENLQSGKTKKQVAREEAEAEKHEKSKKAAIASGRTAEVDKFASELSREEMAEALQRINDRQRLDSLKQNDVKNGMTKVNNIITVAGQVQAASKTVIDLYNTVATVHNSLNPEGHQMKKIGEGPNYDNLTKKFNLEREKERFKHERESWERDAKKYIADQEQTRLKNEHDASLWEREGKRWMWEKELHEQTGAWVGMPKLDKTKVVWDKEAGSYVIEED